MLEKLIIFLRRLEDSLLVLILCTMLGVAVYQILARNLFGGGLNWGDALVRVAVFWVAMVGAMVASRNDEHIRIDVIARFLTPEIKRWVSRVTFLFTALMCLAFTWYSAHFVWLEYQDGVMAFSGVPAWSCEIVMPVSFLVIGMRYLLHGFSPA